MNRSVGLPGHYESLDMRQVPIPRQESIEGDTQLPLAMLAGPAALYRHFKQVPAGRVGAKLFRHSYSHDKEPRFPFICFWCYPQATSALSSMPVLGKNIINDEKKAKKPCA